MEFEHEFIFNGLLTKFSFYEEGTSGSAHYAICNKLSNDKVSGNIATTFSGLDEAYKVQHDFILSFGTMDYFCCMLLHFFKICEEIDLNGDGTHCLLELVKRRRVHINDIIYSYRTDCKKIELIPLDYWGSNHHTYAQSLIDLSHNLIKLASN
jgi:hypothetical protein